METDDTPSAAQNITGRLKDLVGLPPGDYTPDGKGAPLNPDTTPEGGLTPPTPKG